MKKLGLLLWACIACSILTNNAVSQQLEPTYAEKLGYPKGKKVVIFHVDDCGMSYSSNQGAYKSIEQGVATSCSIMMPCPWAASFIHYIQKNHPNLDAGLHLTLTSEWKDYRWPALSGFQQVPTLSDGDGCLWHSVEQVIKNGSPDEVEKEIRAQIERATRLGWKPTHLDSHMGTLFAYPPFLERYLKVGMELGIPVMFPGGNNKMLIESVNKPYIKKMKAEGKWKEGMPLPMAKFGLTDLVTESKKIGEMLWKAGLPVLDDLHSDSGDWKPEGNATPTEWGKYKADQWIYQLQHMKPGVAMLIVHSSDITEEFKFISGSGGSRLADMNSMMHPDLKAYIEKEGIILSTFRELMERRKKVK
ncbi:polysaccharide deacetylase family protein [Aquirufa aurantiipilula]|uniref:Polysaccharide deacetylase family protein n=1 Tax=Aquirufa aurantiipilula TaxID=2696561 RepID=A0ABT6BJ03_9BACT|nr:polysaccharide deacetylase family protein [Aquirufa aurantiipilula]MDF5690180.1 polysaccharide deacetylase family protein [Aquirufa aurantiipilula]